MYHNFSTPPRVLSALQQVLLRPHINSPNFLNVLMVQVQYRVYGGAGSSGLPTQEAALRLKVACDELVDTAVCG